MERINVPFNVYEQRFVLSEAIKTSNVPIAKLVTFIKENEINPDFFQMQVPMGRNLRSCINKYEELKNNPVPNISSLEQAPRLDPVDSTQLLVGDDASPPSENRSSGSPSLAGQHRRESDSHSAANLGQSSKQRTSSIDTPTSTGRNLQPKPATTNGSAPFFIRASQPSPVSPKKRGRPSKADLERRREREIAHGQVIVPDTPQPSPMSQASPMMPVFTPMGSRMTSTGSGLDTENLTPLMVSASQSTNPGSKKRSMQSSSQPLKAARTGESTFPANPIKLKPKLQSPRDGTTMTQPSHTPSRGKPMESFHMPTYNAPNRAPAPASSHNQEMQTGMQSGVQGYQVRSGTPSNVAENQTHSSAQVSVAQQQMSSNTRKNDVEQQLLPRSQSNTAGQGMHSSSRAPAQTHSHPRAHPHPQPHSHAHPHTQSQMQTQAQPQSQGPITSPKPTSQQGQQTPRSDI